MVKFFSQRPNIFCISVFNVGGCLTSCLTFKPFSEADLGGLEQASLFFALTCFFFCNHFEELQTVLFDVELIIDNAPLTHACPNTIKTCLAPNHMLFGRQFLYSSNTTSTVVTNLTGLSSTTDKINRISNHFQDNWRHKWGAQYLLVDGK